MIDNRGVAGQRQGACRVRERVPHVSLLLRDMGATIPALDVHPSQTFPLCSLTLRSCLKLFTASTAGGTYIS
jgi:hypothetical protein